jgi:hypothetical protein
MHWDAGVEEYVASCPLGEVHAQRGVLARFEDEGSVGDESEAAIEHLLLTMRGLLIESLNLISYCIKKASISFSNPYTGPWNRHKFKWRLVST